MKNTLLYLTQLLAISCMLSSCAKEEGEGGKGTIFGTVYKIIDDGNIAFENGTYVFKKDTFSAKDEDVFIIYGDNQNGFDDKTSTSYNGTFRFDYLRDGKYTLYSLSDLASGDKAPVFSQVEVKGGDPVSAGDLYIYDGKNVGKCGIIGKIEAKYKDADGFLPGFSLRVYLKKNGSETVQDTRANENGIYVFPKLDPYSTYTISAETEEDKNTGIEASSITISTGAEGTIVSPSETLYVFVY